jgi:RNA polymerase sigma factor (sigma-70 family)
VTCRKDARNALIESHLRIVEPIARQMLNKRFFRAGRDDLVTDFVAAGNLGLVEAAYTFDPQIARFSTHANFWIRKRIYDQINFVSSNVRRPEGQDVPLDISLSSKWRDDPELSLEDVLLEQERRKLEEMSEEAARQSAVLEDAFEVAKRILDGRDLYIFMGRYVWPPVKLRDLAAEFQVHESMIRKIACRALDRVSKAIRRGWHPNLDRWEASPVRECPVGMRLPSPQLAAPTPSLIGGRYGPHNLEKKYET